MSKEIDENKNMFRGIDNNTMLIQIKGINNSLNRYNNDLIKAKELVNDLNSAWQGPAAEEFQKNINNFFLNLDSLGKCLESNNTVLNKYLSDNEKIISNFIS